MPSMAYTVNGGWRNRVRGSAGGGRWGCRAHRGHEVASASVPERIEKASLPTEARARVAHQSYMYTVLQSVSALDPGRVLIHWKGAKSHVIPHTNTAMTIKRRPGSPQKARGRQSPNHTPDSEVLVRIVLVALTGEWPCRSLMQTQVQRTREGTNIRRVSAGDMRALE